MENSHPDYNISGILGVFVCILLCLSIFCFNCARSHSPSLSIHIYLLRRGARLLCLVLHLLLFSLPSVLLFFFILTQTCFFNPALILFSFLFFSGLLKFEDEARAKSQFMPLARSLLSHVSPRTSQRSSDRQQSSTVTPPPIHKVTRTLFILCVAHLTGLDQEHCIFTSHVLTH